MAINEDAAAKLFPSMNQNTPATPSNQVPRGEGWTSGLKQARDPADQEARASYERLHTPRNPDGSYQKPLVEQKPVATAQQQPNQNVKASANSESNAPVDVAAVVAEHGYDAEALPPEIGDFVKGANLSGEQVKGMMDMHHNAISIAQEKAIAKWTEETLSTLDESEISAAKSAVNTYGTPELKALLHSSGLGSHPEVVRLFARIGRGR